MPLRPPRDIPKRIEELRGYLDPNNPEYQPEQQHINIKAAIALYESGAIDGIQEVYIMDGKIVPQWRIFQGPGCSWNEGMAFQVSAWRVPGPLPGPRRRFDASI